MESSDWKADGGLYSISELEGTFIVTSYHTEVKGFCLPLFLNLDRQGNLEKNLHTCCLLSYCPESLSPLQSCAVFKATQLIAGRAKSR